jgi:serine/threonine protein kinase, bacterial
VGNERVILNGRYRLIRAAGSGATSNVYLAEEVSSGQKVAMKVLKKSVAGVEQMVKRFEREAVLLSALKHPNLVGLLGFEDAPEGLILLLEWVEGQRLDTVLAAGALESVRAISILLQLTRALEAVHSAGIVHRDLKPENIMLETGDVVRLLDFGIARFTDSKAAASTFLSSAGHSTGTPAYLSPEQASGNPADARTDIYAFGVIAYRLLSGVLPFQGPNDFDFILQHTQKKPPKLVPLDDTLRASKLVKLVSRCLEKKASDRYPDGHALRLALETALRDSQVSKRRWWPFS